MKNYRVIHEDSGHSVGPYETEELAMKEAEKLALENYGQTYVVMGFVASYQMKVFTKTNTPTMQAVVPLSVGQH